MKKIFPILTAVILCFSLLVSSASALTVDQALELLEGSYLREIPDGAYQAADLDELFALLGDPYTYYMTAEEYAEFLSDLEGGVSLVGIGVSIQITQQGILILDTLKGGSAQDAGLQAGDLIVAVDGQSCVPADESAQARIAGDAGTYVTITVLHKDGSAEDYSLMRRSIVILNTEAELVHGHVGYIECDSFGEETGELFSQAVQLYDSQADCWIVDLRDNLGGVTASAVTAVGAFAGPGCHLYLQDKSGDVYYYDHEFAALSRDPVIVLTNGNTASASEAFAAGIRDNDSGIIVGTRTYGKGVAQILLTEDDSEYFDGDAMKVTAYRFFSGEGTTTDLIGVIPTLLVPNSQAAAVAQALCGDRDIGSEGKLLVEVSREAFAVELENTSTETLSAIFSALPPSAKVWLSRDTYFWDEYTLDQAAAQLGVSYTSRWFTDLADSPYADEINTLATYHLLLGDGTGAFHPESQLSRADMCAMLTHLLGITYSGSSFFSDVPDNAWYAESVNTMAYLGFVQGYNGKFSPNEPLTREEFYTILGRVARYLNFAVDAYAQELTEDDLAPLSGYAAWAREGTAVLAWSNQEALDRSSSILLDDPENQPAHSPVLREEAAACMYRMLYALGVLTV